VSSNSGVNLEDTWQPELANITILNVANIGVLFFKYIELMETRTPWFKNVDISHILQWNPDETKCQSATTESSLYQGLA